MPCAGAGLRIFRLLKAKRQLEQKQVAEQAVLPPKEANVTLYTLLKGGFVCIQVPARLLSCSLCCVQEGLPINHWGTL